MAGGTTWGLWSLILTASLTLTLTGCTRDFPRNHTSTYTVGSVLVEPFLMAREEGHLGADAEYEGFIPDLLHKLAGILMVKFKIRIQPDGKFGEKQDNGQWDGLVGSLTNQEIDIAAAPLTITSMRHRVIDFSKPFMSTGLVLVISGSLRDGSAPVSMSRLLLVLKPFSTLAWFMLIAGVLLIVIFAVIIHRLNPQDKKTGHIRSVSTLLSTCAGGGPYSGCLLRCTMVNFVLLTLVLYTAGVVSLLLYTTRTENAQRLQKSDYEHVNIADVVELGEYKIAVVSSSAAKTFFRVSKVALYERINEMLTYVENDTAGFDLVLKDPGYAFITDRGLVEYYISRTPYCGLNIVGGSLTANGYGLGYPLNSELKERIDLGILELRENGILQALHRKWWSERAQFNKPTVPGNKKLTPASPGIDSTTLGGVLIILVIGLLLAVGAGVVERFLLSKANTRQDPGHMT